MINIFIFILGSTVGSFLNVLIDRLPKDESINGRSHCDYCKKKIAWYDMFPVLSFFILGGRTRCCNKKLSWQYPIIEILTGTAFLLIFNFQFTHLRQGFDGQAIFNLISYFGLISCLIVIFVSDLKNHLISDYILLALFTFSLLFHLTNSNQFQLFLTNFIPSALIVALPIFLIYFISKEKAMGLGDVYLVAIMGFLLGWKAGYIALYIAFVTGAIFGLIAILLKNKKLKSKVAFGPFLVIGTVTMLFWGGKILEMIMKIYSF